MKLHNNRVGMSNNSPICFPYWTCWTNYLWFRTKLDRIYLAVNMAVALFHKQLQTKWKPHKKINPSNRFVLNCLLYCLLYCLNLAGNPSPVAQKGTRSKYKAATILKSPLLNKPYFFDLAEACPIAYRLLPRVGLLVPIGPSKGSLSGAGGGNIMDHCPCSMLHGP